MPNLLEYDAQTSMRLFAQHVLDIRLREDAMFIGARCGGEFQIVFGFDTFSPTNCFMHIAAPHGFHPIRHNYRYILRWVFDYPFNQVGLRRISSLVSRDNGASNLLTEKRGGTLEGVMRAAGEKGEDMLLYGMLREECSWLSPNLKL